MHGTVGRTRPTTPDTTSRRLFVFDEDEFDLFMRLHRSDWYFGYRVFSYASHEVTASGKEIFGEQTRLYPPVPWMQPIS